LPDQDAAPAQLVGDAGPAEVLPRLGALGEGFQGIDEVVQLPLPEAELGEEDDEAFVQPRRLALVRGEEVVEDAAQFLAALQQVDRRPFVLIDRAAPRLARRL
jgi:hypothetical protein